MKLFEFVEIFIPGYRQGIFLWTEHSDGSTWLLNEFPIIRDEIFRITELENADVLRLIGLKALGFPGVINLVIQTDIQSAGEFKDICKMS